MSKRFIKPPYSASRATPIDSYCCRLPTASALMNRPKFLKAARHAEIRKIVIPRSIGGGGLEPVKLAREPASSLQKPCASLENVPEIYPVRRYLLALRKQTMVRDQLSPQNPPPVHVFDSRVQWCITPLALRRSRCPPSSPDLFLSHPNEPITVRLCVLRRPSGLSPKRPPASRVPHPPEVHQTGARKEARLVDIFFRPCDEIESIHQNLSRI